jgi:enoyl-CoA hydratase/carnithine racemase
MTVNQSQAQVLVEHRGPVCWITINRPASRNALNATVASGLREGILQAMGQAGCRAIVLTGAADKAFCAGADLQKSATGSVFTVDFANPRHYITDLLKLMDTCPLPIVARVNGHAMAGGFGLVCACDLAVSVDSALFGTPEPKIGISPMMILPHMMRVIPRRKLREMCLTGEPLTAQEALEHDIVNYVVPAAQLDERLDWLLQRIVSKSPVGLRLGKQALQAMDSMSMDEALSYAQVMLPVMASTLDAREGILAFQEKRKPSWTAGND